MGEGGAFCMTAYPSVLTLSPSGGPVQAGALFPPEFVMVIIWRADMKLPWALAPEVWRHNGCIPDEK